MQSTKILDSSDDNLSPIIKFFAIIGILSLFFGIVAVAFFAGRKTKEAEILLTPTPSFPKMVNPPTQMPPASPSATVKPESGTTTPTPIPKSVVIQAIDELDGYRSSDGTGSSKKSIKAGMNEHFVSRGFVSFPLDEIPQGSEIVSASLRLYQEEVIGNPYTFGGEISIDHLTYGETLDQSDYARASLLSSFDVLSATKTIGWKEVGITKQVRDDFANARSYSQFRIHFDKELKTNGAENFSYFVSSENAESPGKAPRIVVNYY